MCGDALGLPADRGSEPSCSECGYLSWFRLQEFGQTVVINLLPELDLEYSDVARVVACILGRRPETQVVIVNLSMVRYIGSTFLDRLIIAKRRLTASHARLILCGFNAVVGEVFRVTRLDHFFEIADADAVVPQ